MDGHRVIHILEREYVYAMVTCGHRLTPAEISMIRVIFFPEHCDIEMLIIPNDPIVIFMAIPEREAKENEGANDTA